jgi:predicted nucleic acid-binding protein
LGEAVNRGGLHGLEDPRYVVVDSSVVFKWFCSEDESSIDEALALFADHLARRVMLVAPAHMPAEVLNALALRPHVTSKQLTTAAEALAESELIYPAWDRELLCEAAAIARKHKLTIYDALFPALAIQLGGELVSADRAHRRVSECSVRLWP